MHHSKRSAWNPHAPLPPPHLPLLSLAPTVSWEPTLTVGSGGGVRFDNKLGYVRGTFCELFVLFVFVFVFVAIDIFFLLLIL
jgi:hypothetical protein